ncbi:MAG: substrate-binding domain-containing protein [Prochlorothrix sp.]
MIFSTIARWRSWFVLAFTVAFSLIALGANGATSLLGGGSSFSESLYDAYAPSLAADTGTDIRYLTVGSGPAFRQLGAKTFSFTSTEAPPGPIVFDVLETDQDGLQMVPTGIGGLAIIYNVRGAATDIPISQDVLADIFTGKVNNWQQVSPRLPESDIRVVVRDDFAGANYVISQFLNEVTDGEVEVRPGPRWWRDIGFNPYAARNLDTGVAAAVATTEGSIGYVQLGYALEKNLETARIENRQGNFVRPTLETIEMAAAQAQYDEDFLTSGLVNPEAGYPIVGLNWMVMYKDQADPSIASGLKQVASWILTEGQDVNASKGFAPIAPEVAQRALQAVNQNL